MVIDLRSIQRVESLEPLLRFMSDFSDTIIADDAKDIMVFSTPTHPSPFHHNQWGTLLKFMSEMGMIFLRMGKKVLEQEDRQNMELRQIRRMLQEVMTEREESVIQEKILKEKRVILMKQYFETVRIQPQQISLPHEVIYGGNLDSIRVKKEQKKPSLPEKLPGPPRVPKAKLQL